MDRRHFLKAAGFLTVSSVTRDAWSNDTQTWFPPDRDGRYEFLAGVASADPKPFSVILWTRCSPVAIDDRPVRLTLEIALDASFRRLLFRQRLLARPEYDYTVRHKILALFPYTTYYYRFIAGRDVSPVGRTKTAPLRGFREPAAVKFAYLSCQDWSANHWQTIEALADEDLDFVVHLGDYIYESIGPRTTPVDPAHPPLVLPVGTRLGNDLYASDIDDYRYLYRTYRSDPRMQRLHARHPMVAIWDDHEFSDDSWQEHETYTNANRAQVERRRAANQAWFEYMPADVAFAPDNPSFQNIRIYRDLHYGSLVHLIMTDERLYRSDHVVPEPLVAQQTGADPVNGNSSIGSRYVVDEAVFNALEAQQIAAGQTPTMLGDRQTEWWKYQMKHSRAIWKIWGNEVSLLRMQLDLRTLAPAPFNRLFLLNCDQWDGYNAQRKSLMSFLKEHEIRNVVGITGDIHAFFAGQVFDDYTGASPTPVMVDVTTAGASSTPFFQFIKQGVDANPAFAPLTPLVYVTDSATGGVINRFDTTLRRFNPWLAHVETNTIGYALVTATSEQLNIKLKKFALISPQGIVPEPVPISVTEVWIPSGSPTLQVSAT